MFASLGNTLKSKSLLPLLILLFTANYSSHAVIQTAPERALADIVGVTHVGGRYFFTEGDFLNEGANQILTLGSRVIKVWLTNDYENAYSFHSTWPHNISSLVDLIQTSYYRALLAKPFTTFIFETYEFSQANWSIGISAKDSKHIYTQFYDLAYHLMNAYQNTEKTFVLQNWEADSALNVKQFSPKAANVAIQGLTDYLNLRQDAVSQARKDALAAGISGVNVVAACEVNQVPRIAEKFDYPLVVDRVIPYTHCDLYSFSSWGTNRPGTEAYLTERLNYLASKAPPSALYGHKNIMVGEFGAYEELFADPNHSYPELKGNTGLSQKRSVENQIKLALDWGAPYIIYWQLYSNGLRPGVKLKAGENASMEQLQGIWLIRPDGSYTPTWNYLHELFTTP